MSRDKWGKCLGYVSDPCPNCNRVRLEKYENGKHICEKCEWCPEESRYIDSREVYPIEEHYMSCEGKEIWDDEQNI